MGKSKLEHSTSKPLYHQVKDILLSRIIAGEWKESELIPTELELIEEFDVSRTTIRQAISILEQEGIVQKIQGKGTIVTSLKLTGSLSRLTGFAEELIEEGREPKSILLRAEFRKNLYFEKNKLKVTEAEDILLIQRIRLADDVPIAIEKTYWPKEIGDVLMEHDLNNAKYYKILEDNNIFLKNAQETIAAVNATSYEADLLGVSIGTALLEMTRLSYNVESQPIEYTQTKFRSDLYQYSVNLER